MKIIQLATSLNGGAGSAALRMNNALNIVGADSTIVSRYGISGTSGAEIIATKISSVKKLESSMVTLWQSKIMQKNNDLVTPLSVTTSRVKNNLLAQVDIIHIHAYYNFLNNSSLRRILALGKPTLFTLHDQRLFTGGCHYSRDCKKFQKICSTCPQVRKPFAYFVEKAFSKQADMFRFVNNVELVSPSHWLANFARTGEISKNLPVHVVRNPVPRIFFETKVKEYKTLNGALRVAFIATKLHNPYKELALFTKAINEYSIGSSRKICVVLVGSGIIPKFESAVQIENIQPSNDSEMALLLNTIDLVIVPSNQDNSPSVISEALAVGVPVIGSDAGGIPEILRNFQMPIFPVGDVAKLIDLIANWKPRLDHESIREKAKKEFSEEVVGRDLLRIYMALQTKLSQR